MRRAPWLLLLVAVAACSGDGRPAAVTTSTTDARPTSSSSSTSAVLPTPTTEPPYRPAPPPTLPPVPVPVQALAPRGWVVTQAVLRADRAHQAGHTRFVASSDDGRIQVVTVYPVTSFVEASTTLAGDERIGPYRGRLRYGGRPVSGTDRPDWAIVEVLVPSCGIVAVASLGLDEPTLRATAATATCQAGAGTDITPPPGFRRVPADASGDGRGLGVQMGDREDPRQNVELELLRAGYVDAASFAGLFAVGAPVTIGGYPAWWNLFDPPPTDPSTVSDWQATIDLGPGRLARLFARNLTRSQVDALVERLDAGFDDALPRGAGGDGHVLFDTPTDGATVAVVTSGDRPVVRWSEAAGGDVWAAVVPEPIGPAALSLGPVIAQVDVLGTTVDIDTSVGTWATTVQAADGRWLWLAASGLTPARVRAVLGGLHAVDDDTWAAFTGEHPPVALRP